MDGVQIDSFVYYSIAALMRQMLGFDYPDQRKFRAK